MMKKLILFIFLTLFILRTPSSQAQNNEASPFTEGQLAQLLAPVALYPDTLLTHILIAATYPIEIIEAHRWVIKHPQLSSTQIFDQVSDKDWDPSVKALLPFPMVLKKLNDELSWTTQLGDAFLTDQVQVLSSIQQLRIKAEQAGNLSTMDNMAVSHEDNNIIIEPLEPEIVYVPYYDSRTIYGNWHWAHYQPVYWSHPQRYVGHHPYYWHSGVHISFNYFFSAFHWQNRHLVVLNHRNSHRYLQKKRIVSSHGAKRWLHKPHHRRGVAYSNNQLKKHYKSNRVDKSQRKVIRQKDTQIKAIQNKQKNKSRYSSALNTKHSKTLKQFHKLPNNKKAKGVNKDKVTNKHQNHRINNAKSPKRHVIKDKMRRYENDRKMDKGATRPKLNRSSGRHKIKKNMSRTKMHNSRTKAKNNDNK
jgi:hypothetical protein